MSDKYNNILGLQLPTEPAWANRAIADLQEILSDHAFCEQKAATQCISLIQRYPHLEKLVEALAPIVSEEWGHFRMVLAEIKKRGFALARQRKDEYVNALMAAEPKNPQSHKLLHQLLLCALIEARSCERFRVLANQLKDEYLSQFYYRFMVSEAGHYRLFIDLAKVYFEEDLVSQQWQFWLNTEAAILETLNSSPHRIH